MTFPIRLETFQRKGTTAAPPSGWVVREGASLVTYQGPINPWVCILKVNVKLQEKAAKARSLQPQHCSSTPDGFGRGS